MMLESLIDMIEKKQLVLANFLTANSSFNFNTFHSYNESVGLRGGWVESETHSKHEVHVFEHLLEILKDTLDLDLN